MNKFKNLPDSPGVYKFFNTKDELIYIGKAKNLSKRIASYFNNNSHKNEYFTLMIERVEYIITETEVEALLLEINLIKKHKPRFNIVFKDDKSYPYICLLEKQGELQVKTRRAKLAREKNCFGPFPNGSKAFKLTRIIEEAYKLRKCNDRNKERCLYSQLGQCLHLKGEDKRKYIADSKKEIVSFLKGNTKNIESFLLNKIHSFSDLEEYEMSSKYKTILDKIKLYDGNQIVYSDNNENADYIGFNKEQNFLSVFILYIRNGKILSTFNKIYKTIEDFNTSAIHFLTTFYDVNPTPKLILLSDKFFDKNFTLLDLNIHVPKIGKKKKLVELADTNAKEFLKQNHIQILKDSLAMENWKKLGTLVKIKNLYNLEIYDASHISGSHYVGAKVEFTLGEYIFDRTRKYNLEHLTSSNDTKALRMMLNKRFKNDKKIPDLILIDGSVGQVRFARKELDLLGINVPLIGLVKNERHRLSHLLLESGEIIHFDDNSFKNLLAKMQNKVHEVAIRYHKSKRLKQLKTSWLDDIEGVGFVNKKKLLSHFGDLETIKKAALKDLEKIVSEKIAKNIINKSK